MGNPAAALLFLLLLVLMLLVWLLFREEQQNVRVRSDIFLTVFGNQWEDMDNHGTIEGILEDFMSENPRIAVIYEGLKGSAKSAGARTSRSTVRLNRLPNRMRRGRSRTCISTKPRWPAFTC